MGIITGLLKTSYKISKGIVGTQVSAVESINTKLSINKVKKENEKNKGITNYDPSDIEPFLTDVPSVQNVVLSGLNQDIRNRAINAIIDNAYSNKFHSIVLHNGNPQLEQSILSAFGTGNAFVFNTKNSLYDPIIRLSDQEISKLIIQTASKGHEVASAGQYYIEGMTKYLRYRKKTPYTASYMNCPHQNLIDRISEAEKNGIISSENAQEINSLLLQGITERANIEYFFSLLKDQANQLIAPKANLKDASNLREAIRHNPVTVFDVMSDSNTLLLNILFHEISVLQSRGKKVLTVIDGLQISSNEKIQSLIMNSSANCPIVISEDDVYSSTAGNDSLFFSIVGKAKIIVLNKHSSAYSCEKWANVIGSYEKKEFSTSLSNSSRLFGSNNSGNSRTVNVATKRENIVKPEQIRDMGSSEVYILNQNSGELAHTVIR